MATKISEKTVRALNARCKNGFCFDIRTLLEHNEKQLCRVITLLENRKAITFSLYWTQEVIHRTNEYGCSVAEYTGNFIPRLHCSVWEKSENALCWHSYGLGIFHSVTDHPSPKRLMNALADVTSLITDELMLSLLPEREQAECRQILSHTDTTE